MPYSDKNYLLTIVTPAQLSNISQSKDDNIISAILKADEFVDGYLQSQYNTLPISPVPETLKDASASIAIYKLYFAVSPNMIPEKISELYKNTLNWLKDVARGTIRLQPKLPDAQIETTIINEGYEPRMSRNIM